MRGKALTMILYFSGTGNTLEVASVIAEKTGDKLFDVGTAYRAGSFEVEVEQGENLGFAFPTYRWSTPPLVDEFVRRMSFAVADGDPFVPGYCFTVETYGHFPGRESSFLAKLLFEHQGICVDAAFAVRSVGNCLYLFDTPSDKVVARRLEGAREEAERVAGLVGERRVGERVSANLLGAALSLATGHDEKPRSTKPFNVLADECVGCGTCVAACPTGSVALEDGAPVWSGDRCTECLACLHRCPQAASQYGKVTVGRRRYLNPTLKR